MNSRVDATAPPPDYDAIAIETQVPNGSANTYAIGFETSEARPAVVSQSNNGQMTIVTVSQPINDVQVIQVNAAEDGATFGNSFSNKKIRQAFIKKVYAILMVQLAITVGIICLFMFCKPIHEWIQATPVFYYVSYVVFVATYIILACIPAARRSYTWNFICLLIFTLALSYMTGTICSFYSNTIVLYAMAITAAVTLAISLFAIQTRIDFTMCFGLLFALVMVLFFFGWACLITWLIVGDNFATDVMYCVYGGLAALVISLILIFDTQRVVGGKNRKFQLSPEEYITGALQLYIDIVYLFLIIVGLGGR